MHHVAWRRLCEVGFALDLALGKSCGCGRLESIWFGVIARRCHDPPTPGRVCGYYMVDALEKPARGTLWEQVFAGDGHHDD